LPSKIIVYAILKITYIVCSDAVTNRAVQLQKYARGYN